MGAGFELELRSGDRRSVRLERALHARAAPSGALVVRDRGSRNGTQIDGNLVEGAELRVGSYLTLGRTTLVAIAAPNADRSSAIALLRGHDPVFRATVDQALRAAQTDCNVLIVGETGTGKDLLARVVHEASRRAGRNVRRRQLRRHPARADRLGAVRPREGRVHRRARRPRRLLRRGARRNAVPRRDRRAADRAAAAPPARARVAAACGASAAHRSESVDVRIIAATNRIDGLGTEASRLRLDLYHRLATVVLALPPLRERMGDLVELVETMLAASSRREYGAEAGQRGRLARARELRLAGQRARAAAGAVPRGGARRRTSSARATSSRSCGSAGADRPATRPHPRSRSSRIRR